MQIKTHQCVCCVSVGYTADARLTTTPVDSVALAGTSVTLPCTTDLGGSPAPILWRRNYSRTSLGDPIVELNCQANAAFPQYSVISSSLGQCDLVINNVSPALAANYRCGDTDLDTADAELTVTGVVGKLCVLILGRSAYVGRP